MVGAEVGSRVNYTSRLRGQAMYRISTRHAGRPFRYNSWKRAIFILKLFKLLTSKSHETTLRIADIESYLRKDPIVVGLFSSNVAVRDMMSTCLRIVFKRVEKIRWTAPTPLSLAPSIFFSNKNEKSLSSSRGWWSAAGRSTILFCRTFLHCSNNFRTSLYEWYYDIPPHCLWSLLLA